MNNKNKMRLMLLLAGVSGNLMAGDLTSYATGDVLICFRNGSSGLDLVVDAGPIGNFTSLSVNQTNAITAFTPTQLAEIGINGTSWSAFTWQGDNTLYITKARGTNALGFQTAAWLDKPSNSQHNTALRMATIPTGAYYNYGAGYNDPTSTATAVVEQDSTSSGGLNYPAGLSYNDAIIGSAHGNFSGTFQGNPENTTLATFSTNKFVLRSDFYKLTPTGSYVQAQLLGYFQLNTNGAMSYVAYPSDQPVINSLVRSGSTTTIDYNTGTYGTYTLRGTNVAGLNAPRSTWPVVSTLINDNSSDYLINDTTTDANRIYTIMAQ